MAVLFSGAEPFKQFNRMHYEEHFGEIILNFDQWFRCYLKIFFIFSSSNSLFSGARTIHVILIKGIMRNLCVILN